MARVRRCPAPRAASAARPPGSWPAQNRRLRPGLLKAALQPSIGPGRLGCDRLRRFRHIGATSSTKTTARPHPPGTPGCAGGGSYEGASTRLMCSALFCGVTGCQSRQTWDQPICRSGPQVRTAHTARAEGGELGVRAAKGGEQAQLGIELAAPGHAACAEGQRVDRAEEHRGLCASTGQV